MPNISLHLQLFGEEGMAESGDLANPTAETSADSGVATTDAGESVAPAEDEWTSLINGKYKEQYGNAVKEAVAKRFRNQKDLQVQIDAIDPIVRTIAQKYGVQADANGRIPIDVLTEKLNNDDSLYEKEAFERGMSVEDLKQIKSLERENEMLKRQTRQTEEDREWNEVVQQANALKEMYPSFDIDMEMENPYFGRLLATMKRSGVSNPVQIAYETVHRDEIMGGAMQYAVQKTQQKISNSIQSGMSRPQENGTANQAAGAPTALDPSKLSKDQIEDIKRRAARGERITFQ